MKYRLLLYVFFTLPYLCIRGQESLIGANYKLSISNIETQQQWGDDMRKRNGIGFSLNYNRILKNNLCLSIEFGYHEKGIEGSIFGRDSFGQSNGKIFPTEYYFEYLSIPLMLGYSFGKKFRVIPLLGFRTSYLLKAETKFPIITNQERTGEITSNRTEDLASLDFGFAIKLNCIYFILDNLAIDLEYYFDRSVIDFDENNLFSSGESKHIFIGYSIGIKYLLKK